MYEDYKVGDKVRVTKLIGNDAQNGVKIGDVYEVLGECTWGDGVMVNTSKEKDYLMQSNQIELAQLAKTTQFNFQTKNQITEHLDKVITMYEEYCNDLLKECSTKYNEDYIDLKETGYEYRLELDKILVEVEELL